MLKKYSYSNAFVFLKEDVSRPWNSINMITEIEKYEQNSPNKNVYIDDLDEKKMKKSKSDPEMLKQNLTGDAIGNYNCYLESSTKEMLEKAGDIITSVDDGCNFGIFSLI